MVDALNEVWRVLVRNGALLDLRPRSGRYPVEVVTSERNHRIGEFDGHGMENADRAAEQAVLELAGRGCIIAQQSRRFEVSKYWDSVEEIEPFLNEERRVQGLTPPYSDLKKAYEELRANEVGKFRIRYRLPMMLAVYRRADARWAS